MFRTFKRLFNIGRPPDAIPRVSEAVWPPYRAHYGDGEPLRVSGLWLLCDHAVMAQKLLDDGERESLRTLQAMETVNRRGHVLPIPVGKLQIEAHFAVHDGPPTHRFPVGSGRELMGHLHVPTGRLYGPGIQGFRLMHEEGPLERLDEWKTHALDVKPGHYAVRVFLHEPLPGFERRKCFIDLWPADTVVTHWQPLCKEPLWPYGPWRTPPRAEERLRPSSWWEGIKAAYDHAHILHVASGASMLAMTDATLPANKTLDAKEAEILIGYDTDAMSALPQGANVLPFMFTEQWFGMKVALRIVDEGTPPVVSDAGRDGFTAWLKVPSGKLFLGCMSKVASAYESDGVLDMNESHIIDVPAGAIGVRVVVRGDVHRDDEPSLFVDVWPLRGTTRTSTWKVLTLGPDWFFN